MDVNKKLKRFSIVFYMTFVFTNTVFMGYYFLHNLLYGKTVLIEPNQSISLIELIIIVITLILFMYWSIRFLKTIPLEEVF